MYTEQDPTAKKANIRQRLLKTGSIIALGAAAFGISGCSPTAEATPVATTTATAETTSSPTPEVEEPVKMIEAFMGTEVPENIYTDNSEMPTDILKGSLYETLTPDQQARVDTWYEAIYTSGTFLDLPLEERVAAASYAFAANMAGANARLENPDYSYILDAQNEMGTPALDNTPAQIMIQTEMRQTMAGQFAIDTDPSDTNLAPVFDKTLAAAILAGLHTDPVLQQANIDRMNSTTEYINFPIPELFENEIINPVQNGNTVNMTIASIHNGNVYPVSAEYIQFTDIYGNVHNAWITH